MVDKANFFLCLLFFWVKPGWERQAELQVLKRWSRLGVKELLPATEEQRREKGCRDHERTGKGRGNPGLGACSERWCDGDMAGHGRKAEEKGHVR